MVSPAKLVQRLKASTALTAIIAIVSIITLIVVSTKQCKCNCGPQENFRWWWQPKPIPRVRTRPVLLDSDELVLRRTRPDWRDSESRVTTVHDDFEYKWSEGAAGLTYFKDNNEYVTTGKDGRRLIVTSINSIGGFADLQEDFPMFTDCYDNGKYGQGDFYESTKMLVPIICGNDTLLNIRSGSRLGTRLTVRIPGIKARWVAYDKITGMMFVPHDQPNNKLLKIGIYKFTDIPLRSTIRYVRDLTLTQRIEDCTAGVFSEDGILWLLENGRDQGRVLGFHISLDGVGNVIGRRKKIVNIPRPSSGILDRQDFVGLARRNGDLMALLRNQDIGTDNVSIFQISGLM